MFDSIYLPVDNSDYSNTCIDIGLELAQKFGSTIVASHVYAAKMHDVRFRQMESGLPEEYQEEDELEKQRNIHDQLITKGMEVITDSYLDVPKDRTTKLNIPFEGKSLEGRNYTELVRDIKESNYDLVIMGALGLGAIKDSLIGTVAERVVRRIQTDTLLVKYIPQIHGARSSSDKIVVAVDGSQQSFGGLKTGMELSKALNKPLEIISTFDPYFHYAMFNSLTGVLSKEAGKVFKFEQQEKLHEDIIDKGLAKIYQAHLEISKKIVEDEGMECTIRLLDGKVFEKVLQYAQVVLMFQIETPKVYRSPKNLELANLYESAVKEGLNELVYPIQEAGLSYSLSTNKKGVVLTLGGYSERIGDLIKLVTKNLTNINIDEQKFNNFKEAMIRGLKNKKLNQAYQRGGYYNWLMMLDNQYTDEEKLEALSPLTLDDVKSFAKKLYERVYVTGVIHGNWTDEQAKESVSILLDSLNGKSLPVDERYEQIVEVLNPGEQIQFSQEVQDNNNSLSYTIQVGEKDLALMAKASIIASIVENDFYTQMRTNQQLGYIVWSFQQRTEKRLFFRFLIQSSTHGPFEMSKRVRVWLKTTDRMFANLSDEEFEKHRQAKIIALEKEGDSIGAVIGDLYTFATDEEGDFQFKKKLIQAIKDLSKNDVVGKARELFLDPQTPRLEVLMRAKGSTEAVPASAITSVAEFKNRAKRKKLEEERKKLEALRLAEENRQRQQQAQAKKEPTPKKQTPQSGIGSGFFVSKMGHVITNAHVVQNCSKVTIGDNANKQVPAEIINTDRSNDLALLKLSTLEMASAESKSLIQKLGIVVVPLATNGLLRNEDVRLGEKVLVAGYPFGDVFSNTIKVTSGIVSATRGAGDDSGQFQLDAAVQPGNSGGPIYDSGGNIVGVVISQLDKRMMEKAIGSMPENMNFGIKASTVRQFLTSSGLPSKKSERTEEKSTEQLAKIAQSQALMVKCLQR